MVHHPEHQLHILVFKFLCCSENSLSPVFMFFDVSIASPPYFLTTSKNFVITTNNYTIEFLDNIALFKV